MHHTWIPECARIRVSCKGCMPSGNITNLVFNISTLWLIFEGSRMTGCHFIYFIGKSCVLSDPDCEEGKICVSWNGEGEGMGTCKPRCLTNSDCMENEICETTGPDLPCFIGNCACLGSRRNSGKSFIGYIKWGI